MQAEAREVASQLVMDRTAPMTMHYLLQKVKSAMVKVSQKNECDRCYQEQGMAFLDDSDEEKSDSQESRKNAD